MSAGLYARLVRYVLPLLLALVAGEQASAQALLPERRERPLGVRVGGAAPAADPNRNGYTDVMGGTGRIVEPLEATGLSPDVTPPYVTALMPDEGASYVSVDTTLHAVFSEPIDPATLAGHVALTADGVPVSFELGYDGTTLTLTPTEDLPGDAVIEIGLSGLIADPSGNGLDGNGNGVSDGDGLDDVTWPFMTGSGTDTQGPVVTGLTADPASVWVGAPLHISAVASDSSTVATGRVAAAELFLDAPGTPGTGLPLVTDDAGFDTAVETILGAPSTADWVAGERTVFVRARDDRGAWGAPASLVITVLAEESPDWPMVGQNPQHTGFSPGSELAWPLGQEWETPTNGIGRGGVVASGHALYAVYGGTPNRIVVNSFDQDTGALRWSRTFDDMYSAGTPAVAYGRVYVQISSYTSPSTLTALDAETGAIVWQSQTGSRWAIDSAPVVANGKVFVNGGANWGMFGYDAFTGETLWYVRLPDAVNWSPAYADGIVYVSFSGDYYAIDAETGSVLRTPSTFGGTTLTTMIHNGTLFVGAPTRAIDLATGLTRWSLNDPDAYFQAAVGYGSVFLANGWGLRAVDEETGALQWQLSLELDGRAPQLAGGLVFVSSATHTYIVDPANPSSARSLDVGGPFVLTPDRLYTVGSEAVRSFMPITVATDPDAGSLVAFTLRPVSPNPVRTGATVEYGLPASTDVVLEVFDVIGRHVTTLVDGPQQAGMHRIEWAPAGLQNGTYIVRLRAGTKVATVRAVLAR